MASEKKSPLRRLARAAALAACAAFAWSVPCFAQDSGLFVKKIEGLSPAFIRGADVSSVLSLERSGVVFRDSGGAPKDIFATLKESGINSVRLRVWNDPFDAEGRGFGGGDCDLGAAIEMGKRASRQGLSVLLDFHYSDFWADPSKQQAPRAWKGLAIDAKAEALYAFTKGCIAKAIDSGVDVRMVQLGNETTGAMCGEKNWIGIAKLLKAGSRAAREVSAEKKRPIEIALHFTNPEKSGEYERYVKILQKQDVDYDVFATSYYPYWHGTLGNLTEVLKRVARDSGKKVLCAEFSYARTYEDGDGFPNTISRDTVCSKPYPVTVQGQADSVRDVMAAVSAVGDAGIGVYYWEPAWLPVPGKDAEARKALWEKYGSGWASIYAAVYDPADAGKYYGGSSWDNQAMFGFDGRPLSSLSVWKLAATGAATALRPDSVADTAVKARLGDAVALPETVEVIFNDGSKRAMPVSWEAAGSMAGTSADYGKAVRVSDMPKGGPAEYDLSGSVMDPAGGGSAAPVSAHARISVIEKNYLDNPSFEDADASMWKIENIGGTTSELFVQDKVSDAKTGAKALHFWSKGKVAFSVEQTVKGLAPGTYRFSVAIHGGDAKNQDMRIYALSGGKRYETKTDVDGWRNFRKPSIAEIPVVDGAVTVGAYVSCDANGWGSLDDFILSPVE